MLKPDKTFEHRGVTYPLDSATPRVGKRMIETKLDELVTQYSNGLSEISNYSGEVFGEIGNTQFVHFSTDSPEALINFIRENHHLEPVTGTAVLASYGSISKAKFIKPVVLVESEVNALAAVAEASVKDDVEAFKNALEVAKKRYVEDYSAYQKYLKAEEQRLIDQENQDEAFLRSLH